MGEFEGEIKLEGGNYNAQRARVMVNIPLGEQFAIRVAGAATRRDGYGYNEFDGSDVDDRNLWSLRTTLGWEPNERFRANLLWERFEEDDERVRTSKQLCKRDPGLEVIDGFVVNNHANPIARFGSETSQGCLPTSLYADEAFGTPNGASLPPVLGSYFATLFTSFPGGFGYRPDADRTNPELAECPLILGDEFGSNAGYMLNICQFDPYGGKMQSRDLRTIESRIRPAYRAKADIFDLSWDWQVTDDLTLTSQTVYNEDEIYSTQDFNRFHTLPAFTDTAALCGNAGHINGGPCNPGTYGGGIFVDYAPGGVYTDPQLGPSDTIMGQDISQGGSKQFTQEFRLASSWEGPVNFSLGANYTKFEVDIDYYVFFNVLSYLAEKTALFNGPAAPFVIFGSPCASNGLRCIYVDPNPLDQIDGQGHNYFRSRNPYELDSTGVFGELYWQATDNVKVTAGLRYSWDEKVFTPYPTQLLLYDYRELVLSDGETLYLEPGSPPEACLERPHTDYTYLCPAAGDAPGGRGFVAGEDIVQEWREPTGRLVVDWKPDLGFTDETMLYASYAHGYKGGGANPPSIAPPAGLYIAAAAGAVARPTFDPEYVDAFELGSKNTLLGGGLILNGAAFYYDYQGYQVSKIVDRTAANENFDATVWGLELEGIFSPTRDLRFNFALGFLDTEIAEGERSIDLMDRTQGGNHSSYIDINGVEHQLGYDEWIVLKPWINGTSNCVVPAELVRRQYESGNPVFGGFCLGGGFNGQNFVTGTIPGAGEPHFNPLTEAPNAGAGFFDELGGNELPNAPHWTASVGAQYSFGLPAGWEATLRGDFYWQSQSFARVYNTQYDKLRAWTNTNISLWFEHEDWGVTAEVYVKNAFDEEPITDAFLNGDDAALTTNVFTLDPRLIGVSVTKRF
ncbi:MAG TPA: TonB-dependent receptor, partial [Caulobacteraceae bacterium]|nr:TonB-dependent receptor [Caulobacteraceae bacterium]